MMRLEIDQKSMKDLEDTLEGLSPKKAKSVVRKGFVSAALLIERNLKINLSGNILQRRTGHLRSSIGSVVSTEDGLPVATIGSGVRQGARLPYANIQETGGDVRPKLREYLTIPLRAAQTEAGQTRFTAREVKAGSTKYQASFIRNHIIFGVIQKGSSSRRSIVPLFVLKKSVTIPASRYLTITRDQTEKDVDGELVKAVKEAIEQGGQA